MEKEPQDFRDHVLTVAIYATFVVGIVFSIIVPVFGIASGPLAQKIFIGLITANSLNGLFCLWLKKTKRCSHLTITNILLYTGIFLVGGMITCIGSSGKESLYTFILIILFANLAGGYLDGLLVCGLITAIMAILIYLQIQFPLLGEIAFNSGQSWEMVLFKNSFACFFTSALAGWAAQTIIRQEKRLREQNKKLLELDQYKRLFTDAFVHEIRTPLAGISTSLELLSDELPEKNQQIEDYLKDIAELSEKLKKMVDEILTISQLDSSNFKIEKEKVSISNLTVGVLSTYLREAEKKGIKIVLSITEEPCFAEVSEPHFLIAVSNLLSNAVKFTSEGGTIKITLKKNFGKISFTVEDTGEGISTKELPYIFDKFHTTETGRIGGLGLYATKRIIEMHQGTVFVSSRRGYGTRIGFEIPESSKGEVKKMNSILIVEDDNFLRRNLRKIIEKWALQKKIELKLEDVGTKEGAEAYLKRNEVDLVLLDIMLGQDKNAGQEIAKNANLGKYKSFPKIIMLTARGTSADVIEAGKSNVAGYVIKPFNRNELTQRIENVLGISEEGKSNFFEDVMHRIQQVRSEENEKK